MESRLTSIKDSKIHYEYEYRHDYDCCESVYGRLRLLGGLTRLP